VDAGPLGHRAEEEDPTPPVCWLPWDQEAEPLPVVYLSGAAARSILAALGLDGPKPDAGGPRHLPGASATLHTGGNERMVESRNVIGFFAGSDPALRDEAVVIGAHLDHLGRPGGVIHPGADDNASGVAALLEIARGMASLPAAPKRSVIVAFWTGEEEGKFGSGYFVRHPRWPLSRTAVYINLDMIGHPWLAEELAKLVTDSALPEGSEFLSRTKALEFAEPGLPVDAPELAAALRWAGPAVGMALHLDRCDGTRGGSDYRDFARARVPWIRFFGNFFPGYHEPGDTPEALDPAQVQRMARLAFATAWRLAER
jgi:Zn-dependent M28 family amino/carboxypeptidase